MRAVLAVALCFGACDDAPRPVPNEIRCGDGDQDDGEMCDDGNTVHGDGCRADCRGREQCLDGLLDVGEACDDANLTKGDGCDVCVRESCGDGVPVAGEFCYRPRSSFAAGFGTNVDLTTGDFDGDGLTDMATISMPGFETVANRVNVLLADGRGGFDPPIGVPIAGSPTGIVAGDWDRDGDSDLAISLGFRPFGTGPFVSLSRLVLLSGGDGRTWTMTEAGLFVSTGLVAMDVDADGDLDLVQALGSTLSPLMNDGAGVFTPGESVVLQDSVESLAAGDWDADGRTDLVAVAGPEIDLLHNRGDHFTVDVVGVGPCGFGSICRTPLSGDFDGDGDEDIYITSGYDEAVQVTNDGGGSFTVVPVPFVATALVADLDSDGDDDLVPSPDGSGLAAAAIDMDGDGGPEVLTIGAETIHLFGNEGGVLSRPEIIPGGGYPVYSFELGDVDGDGDLDAVALESENGTTARVLANDGAGGLTEIGRATLFEWIGTNLELADLDGDGDLDLASGWGSVLFNDGSGAFGGGFVMPGEGYVDIGDVDGDGDPDLVNVVQDNEVVTHVNDGSAGFSTQSLTVEGTLGCCWRGIQLTELDGDGDLDAVVWGNGIWLLANTGGTFTVAAALDTNGEAPGSVIAFDQDGDGRSEVTTMLEGDIVSFREEGLFDFRPFRFIPTTADFSVFAAGDLDGDGFGDLAFGASEQLTLLRNNAGLFEHALDLPVVASGIMDVELGDLNGDGLVDILTTSAWEMTSHQSDP